MSGEYGTVVSSVEGPSTRKFSFVIKKDASVRKGQFVEVAVDGGRIIGRVDDIFKTNRYFMRPESVEKYESSKPMEDIFPVSNWEYLVADVTPLGVYSKSEESFQEVSFPPSPGTHVCSPDVQILARFLGLDEKGLEIGTLPHHDIKVRLNLTRLLQKHLAVLAISGAGKSYLMSVLIEELLARKPEDGQVAVVIVDTHGEYTSFAKDKNYADRVNVFSASDIRVGLSGLSHHQLAEFLPKLSSVQIRELSRLFRDLKGEKIKNYTLAELIETIEEDEKIKSGTKDVLMSILEELGGTGLFGVSDYPNMDALAVQGKIGIIDLSQETSTQMKQMVVAHISRKLFNKRRAGEIPPFLLVVEEAHQFVPEGAKSEQALSRSILRTIAREGRKFHASLCLISQRPIQLDTTTLSQCNTHIILRVTNPYDLDHIGKSSEGLNKEVLGQISGLRVGTGLIVGEAVNFPVFVKIRKRGSRDAETGLPLERAAVEYMNTAAQKRKDSRAFM